MTLGANAEIKGFQNSAFGQCGNVTGGAGGTVKIISNGSVSSLEAAMKASGKAIIIITKDITFTNHLSVQVKDKTILAMPGVKLISAQQDSSTSGILYIKSGSSNVIFRNLTFEGPGAYDCDGWDNLCFDGVTNAWVDHCDFQDGCDGNFDNKGNTDNITISWCRFHYLKPPKAGGSGGSADHRFTNLIGSSSSAKPTDGRYTMTWAYCWWDEGCRERMPRVRNADLHMLNDVWTSSVANYYVGPENAAAVFDGCWFGSSKNVFKSYGGTNHVKYNGCYSKAGVSLSNSGTTANISYSYSVLSYTDAYNAVTNTTTGAGATLRVNQSTGECTAGDGSTSSGGGSTGGASTTTYTVTASAGTGGIATVDKNSVAAGGTATFTAIPNSGYAFVGWTNSNGSTVSTSNPYTATINANISLKANFQSQTACAITACTVNGSAATISGTNITATVPFNAPTSGIVVNLTLSDGATANTGTSFTKTLAATEGATNAQTIVVTAKDGSTKQTYILTIKRAGNATVLDVRGGSVAAGGNFTGSTATTDQRFTSGTEVTDGTDVSPMSGNSDSVYRSSDALSITIGNLPSSVSSITFGATSSGTSERTVTGVSVNGVAASGYTVDGTVADRNTVHRVTISGLSASAGNSITITMSGNTHFYYFELTGGVSVPVVTRYTVKFYNGDEVVSTQSLESGSYASAPTVLTKDGYIFVGWATTNGGTTAVDVDATAITADTNYYAIWQKIPEEQQPTDDEGAVTYNLNIGTSANKLTSSNTTSSDKIINLVGITAPTADAAGKANLTVKINGGENNSAMVGFSVADGYKFTPSTVSVKLQPVGTSSTLTNETNTVKLVLSDGVNTLEKTYSNVEGTIATNVMENVDGIEFTGSVTLNIYSYGDCPTYRLGSPILIQGEIVEGSEISKDLILLDGEDYISTEDKTFRSVQFKKNLSNIGKWTPLYVPFSIDVNEYAEIFDIAQVFAFCPLRDTNGDGEITAEDDDMLIIAKLKDGITTPNNPYLIRPKVTGEQTIYSSDNTVYAVPTNSSVNCFTTQHLYTVYGTYSSVVANAENGYYYVSGGSLSHRTSGSTTIKSNRWYLVKTERLDNYHTPVDNPAQAKQAVIEIVVNGEDTESSTTGIGTLAYPLGADADIYNLQGVKMNKSSIAPGVYVVNGRKVVVK